MSFFASLIVISVFLKDISNPAFLVILLSFMGSFIYVLWKFYDKFLIKYNAILNITDGFFELNQSRYNWEDVEWHRTDMNSAIMNAFIVGIKGSSSLKFHVTNKKGNELESWQKMKNEFLETLSSKNINVRNYYNSIFWRRTARIILVSNFLIPLILIASGFNFLKFLPGFLVWIGTSIAFSVTIFSNQKN